MKKKRKLKWRWVIVSIPISIIVIGLAIVGYFGWVFKAERALGTHSGD